MENDLKITDKARQYVLELFTNKISNQHFYHSYIHTVDTVEEVKKLAKHYQLSNPDKEILLLAAWFHDTGYAVNYDDNEPDSAKFAREFLEKEGYPPERISEVERMILSTEKDHVPVDLLEEILHDADLSHVGRKSFFRSGESLRMEWETILDKQYTNLEWEVEQLEFLQNTPFYTDYFNKNRQERRLKNIEEQRKRLLKAQKDDEKQNAPGRGTETMYRSIYRNHINLSSIADSKANMMISINTIIMSVIITVVGSGFTFSGQMFFEHLRFTLPIVLLLATTLTSVIFAILSASPNVTSKRISREDLIEKRSSLLFFGNFSEIPMSRFLEDMAALRESKDLLYDNMTIDIYHLGQVLTRKYRLLRISYLTFLGGIVISVLAFLLIFLNSYNAPDPV